MIPRQRVIDIVSSWEGTPYRHQASVKGAGCDCLGLIRGVYRELYDCDDPERPPAYQPNWYEVSNRDPLLEAGNRHLVPVEYAAPGDVLVFRMKPESSAKHCGILVENDMMVHSYSKGKVVRVSLGDWWWRRVAGVFRFPNVEDSWQP